MYTRRQGFPRYPERNSSASREAGTASTTLFQTRTQIEQLQGQLNSLKNQVDFSTITISVAPLIAVTGPTGTWDPSVTFARALAALGQLMRGLADVAIWLLVFGWIPLVALAFLFAALRLRRPTPA